MIQDCLTAPASEMTDFTAFFAPLADRPTYFEPLAGNNGDRLIAHAARHLLQAMRCRLVESSEEAGQILINGGGAMTPGWRGLDVLERYRTSFPDKPLIVAPSSFQSEPEEICRICSLGSGPVTLFARERYSHALLQRVRSQMPGSVRVGLSADLVFSLRQAPLVNELRQNASSRHVLVAMRTDGEGTRSKTLSRIRARWLPDVIRRPLSIARDRLVGRRSSGDLRPMLQRLGVDRDIPVVYRDVSSTAVPFETFLASVRDAAAIITDRLHVGILSHLLEKPLILLAGNYHKIRGVYELSMAGQSSTLFWESSSR